MRPKDSQRSKFYEANAEFKKVTCSIRYSTDFDFVDKILHITDSAWFRNRVGLLSSLSDIIQWLDKQQHLDRFVILQAIAYFSIPYDCSWHGREFCRLYLDLIKKYDGHENFKLLKFFYVKHKVKHCASRQSKTRRTMPAAAIEKLNEYRAKRGMRLMPVKKERRILPEVKQAMTLIRKFMPPD